MTVRKASSRKEAEKLAVLHHAIICIGIDPDRIPVHLVVNRNDFALAQKVNSLHKVLRRYPYTKEVFITPKNRQKTKDFVFIDEDEKKNGETIIRHIQALTQVLYDRAFFAYWED